MFTADTRSRRVATLVCLAALLVAAVAPAVAVSVRDADLAIDQPHYVDSDVSRSTTNDTVIYRVRGEELELTPQNFAAENVVDFGVTDGNASLTYDQATGEFTFVPEDGTGTYHLYWQVQRPTATGNNSTAPRQYRYEARIRVEGGVGLVHRQAGSLQDTRDAAANWREFNSTMHQRGLVGPGGIEQATTESINWYELHPSNNPFSALTGGIWGWFVIGFTTTAILGLIGIVGWAVRIIRAERRKRHIHEAIEAEEGTAKEALADLSKEERKRVLQNRFFRDLDGFDDHISYAWGKMFGENLHDGTVEYLSAMMPRNLISDRLQAMGHDGYVAVVERAAGDGDTDETVIEAAELVHADHVADDTDPADVVDLASADRGTVDAVRDALDSWDSEPLRVFDLASADYDATALDTTYESHDLDTVIERLQADVRHFESSEAFGEYMLEFLEAVEDSPICDEAGRPQEIRWVMTHFLKHAQLLDDRFDFPLVHYHREAIERALIDYDPDQEARDRIDDIRAGRA